MQKEINLATSVYDLVKDYPEIKDIMVELGFESITQGTMLNTVGRFMTIPKGAAMKGIELDKIKSKFIEKGFRIIEEE